MNKRIFIVDLNYSFKFANLVTLQIKLIDKFNDEHYIQVYILYNKSNIKSCTILTELQISLKKEKQIQQRKFQFVHTTHHNEKFQHSSFDLKKRSSQSEFKSVRIISNNELISAYFES